MDALQVERSGGSLLPGIIGLKAVEAALLVGLGTTLFLTRHADPSDLMVRFALAVHLPVTSRVFNEVLELTANLTVRRHVALALTAFFYAALMGTEGTGLYLRKPWARWFTIIATSSLIPLEVYEIVRVVRVLRIAILLINIAIVVYLARRKDIFE